MQVSTTPKLKLAKLVKELRGEKSQRNFAKLLGVSYYAVQTWEKQAALPDEKNLQKLADLKGWTLLQLQIYLQDSEKNNVAITDRTDDSSWLENVRNGQPTQALRWSIDDLIAEVRTLPFDAAAKVAQVALETMTVKGS
ncbi:helix-turn-helix transcriptional regulator [Phormidium sp. LEGE 05292]|uniref:helix-turn-helix domain-containing protein n=1 Tax=[Phormidium] sp. LEGE 05292 TaxID=767427 RepID=UPI00187E3070|nr:helix-turn-helix transcriptional regulator [Phormidium sp. LEGE 05292]MBE9225338.1 helix-turn-helix transcriptional regulator [Phormidium sp. LEGE 05292]